METDYRLKPVLFRVVPRWFEGSCEIQTCELDELLGTKLRALYQRKRGRDLFDLAVALKDQKADPARIVEAFSIYMDHEGRKVTRVQFERNLALKMSDPQFLADIGALLAAGYEWDPEAEAAVVSSRLIALLPGKPWKGKKSVGWNRRLVGRWARSADGTKTARSSERALAVAISC